MQNKEEEKTHFPILLLSRRQQELPHGAFQNLVFGNGNPGYGISIFMFYMKIGNQVKQSKHLYFTTLALIFPFTYGTITLSTYCSMGNEIQ